MIQGCRFWGMPEYYRNAGSKILTHIKPAGSLLSGAFYRPGRPLAGQYASTQEGAFQSTFPMQASTAKSGSFTHRVQSWNNLTFFTEHLAVNVSLNTAQTLAGQDEVTNRYEWHG
jgi:hypothetical protein